jgi:hypothetical protein
MCGKNELTRHPTPSIMHPLHRGIRQLYPKSVPRLPWGLPKLRVQRDTRQLGQSRPATKARDEVTQGVASSWLIWSPIEGIQHTQASYLSLNQKVSFTSFHVGWHRVTQVNPIGITRERRLKPPGPDFDGGGGALAPIWPYGEAHAIAGSHP